MDGLESFITNGKQLDLLLMSFVFGAPLGVLYDLFRAVRLIFPHGKTAVLIEDLLFFFIYGIFIMSFTVTAARSEFRFFYPLCNALGFIVYFVTLGSKTRKLLCKVIKKSEPAVKYIVKKLVSICAKTAFKFSATLQIVHFGKKIHDNPLIDEGDLLYNSNTDIEKTKNKRRNVKKIGSR